MKSVICALFLLVAVCSAFQVLPHRQPTTTSLYMGLFDGGKKKQPEKRNVFAGGAPRITVRQDEDAAMWIEEEPKGKKDDKKGGKKKGGIFGN